MVGPGFFLYALSDRNNTGIREAYAPEFSLSIADVRSLPRENLRLGPQQGLLLGRDASEETTVNGLGFSLHLQQQMGINRPLLLVPPALTARAAGSRNLRVVPRSPALPSVS